MKPIYKALILTFIGIVSVISLIAILLYWDYKTSTRNYEKCLKEWSYIGTAEEAEAECGFFLE